jgi:hypothetical protein
MCDVLKLILQGKSCYAIARELDMDPPSIYVSYHAAKENLPKIDKMLTELKALGWPDKLAEAEIRTKNPRRRAKRTLEIAMKLG